VTKNGAVPGHDAEVSRLLRIGPHVAALVLLAGTLSACGSKPGSREQGRLVYSVGPGRSSDIAGLFFVDDDGGHRRRLAHAGPPAALGTPEWSPAGGKILFETNLGEVWTINAAINADGTGGRPIAAGLDPSWAPDGRHFAVAGGRSITILSAEGVETRDIRLGASDADTQEVDWSPDGSRLAVAVEGEDASQIYAVAADGTGEARPLTRLQDDALDESPLWSPDGKMIAFTRYFDRSEAWVMRGDGSEQKLVARQPRQDPDFSWAALAWTPEGKSLVCGHSEGGDVSVHALAGGAPQYISPPESEAR
jgi:Tol biopolymer transport system component